MIPAFGLACPVALAVVLTVSGVAKLRQVEATRSSFEQLRLPAWVTRTPAPTLLPWGELALALAQLVAPGPWGVAASAATLALMVAYLVVIVRALGFGHPVTCGCFGDLGLGLVDRRTAWRNALLVGLAAAGLAAAVLDPRSPGQRWLGAGAADWGWLVACVVLVVLAGLVVGGGAGRVPAAAPAAPVDEELDYLRAPTPYAELRAADGEPVTLRQLARAQARLLVFTDAWCGSCTGVLARFDEWRAALEPAVGLHAVFGVAGPDDLAKASEQVRAELATAYFDPDHHTAELLEAYGAPVAVLLGTDDQLAGGPAAGRAEVVGLVEQVVAQLHGSAPERQ